MAPSRQHDGRLELVIGSLRDYAIVMLDASGRIESWNLGAQAVKGYVADEVVGKPMDMFYTPEDLAAGKPAKLLAEARERGRVEDLGWRMRKDGSRFWADVVITAIHDSTGELTGFAKITRDLTDRREAEANRLAEAARFQTIIEAARDYAIFMLDPSGRVMTWNPGARRINGYVADEVIGRHFSLFYPPEVVAAGKCEAELEIALRDGKFEEEGWRVRKDGSQFWSSVLITPLRDRAGDHIGFSKITRDLTERRAAEDDRIQLAQTQEALRLRDEFLSIAAHELRTPLVALELQVESMRDLKHEIDPKFHKKLDRAERNVQRLADLIATLLDVSRISTGQLTLAPQHVDLGAIVADAIDRQTEPGAATKCDVRSDIAPGIVGWFDPLRIGQVVTNLLANTFKYASGTPVEVVVARDGDDAVIRVADRGPGIPEELRDKVFERFERGTTRRQGGMGLGLYVARQIATAHGGSIRALDREGGGTVLEVRLPIRHTDPMSVRGGS